MIVGTGLILVAAICFYAVNWDYLRALQFSVVWQYRSTLLDGLAVTGLYFVAGVVLGFSLGILLAFTSLIPSWFVRIIILVFVEFWRNTPLLVQLFWVHFGVPLLTGYSTTMTVSGLIALVANTAAYYTEIMRAGINTIPKGQWEAGEALGLKYRTQLIKVILPQAIANVIPPSTSQAIAVFKGTSILSILGIAELMRQTIRISEFTFRVVEMYTAAAVIYAALGLLLVHFGRTILERRLRRWVH